MQSSKLIFILYSDFQYLALGCSPDKKNVKNQDCALHHSSMPSLCDNKVSYIKFNGPNFKAELWCLQKYYVDIV
jgi:hypothetical protein